MLHFSQIHTDVGSFFIGKYYVYVISKPFFSRSPYLENIKRKEFYKCKYCYFECFKFFVSFKLLKLYKFFFTSMCFETSSKCTIR